MIIKRIYNYDVRIDEAGKVEAITTSEGVNYRRVYPYKYNNDYNSYVQQYNLTFKQLQNALYKKTMILK